MNSIDIFKPYINKGLSKGTEGKPRSEQGPKKNVYKLSSNENLLGPSPKAIDAIASNMHELSEYPDKTSHRLRLALSKTYEERLEPENFFCCNSGTGILELIITAFLDAGTECIYSGATFEPFCLFPNKVGAQAINVPLQGPDFKLNVNGILQAVNSRTRIVWLCTPNNPTGSYIPKRDLDYLINRLPEHVVMVCDEVYHHFADAEDYTTALPYVEEGKKVIGVNSFSKVYGLAGMRVGYGYTTPELSEYLNKAIRPFLINTLTLEAAIAALGDIDFVAKTVRTVSEGKKYLYDKLSKMQITFWKSQTNFVLLKLPMNNIAFEEKMLQEGIMVRPIHSFETDDYVRVTVGTRDSNRAFIRGLKNVLGPLCENCENCKCNSETATAPLLGA